MARRLHAQEGRRLTRGHDASARTPDSSWYAAVAAVAAVFIMIAVFQPFAKPEPKAARTYGCYAADGAPAIRLDATGMHVLQKGFPRIPFHIERHKMAITLTADAPIRADRTDGRYLYSMYRPGIGTYLEFRRADDGAGEFDEARLSRFVMTATDGTDLIYDRTSPDGC